MSGQIEWKSELDTGGLVIVPHLTVVERKERFGYFFSRQAPRMGINFLSGRKVFVPNLDAGDLVHLMDVLGRLQKTKRVSN